jgi:hypothetical protein
MLPRLVFLRQYRGGVLKFTEFACGFCAPFGSLFLVDKP